MMIMMTNMLATMAQYTDITLETVEFLNNWDEDTLSEILSTFSSSDDNYSTSNSSVSDFGSDWSSDDGSSSDEDEQADNTNDFRLYLFQEINNSITYTRNRLINIIDEEVKSFMDCFRNDTRLHLSGFNQWVEPTYSRLHTFEFNPTRIRIVGDIVNNALTMTGHPINGSSNALRIMGNSVTPWITEVVNSSRFVAIETPQVMLNYASWLSHQLLVYIELGIQYKFEYVNSLGSYKCTVTLPDGRNLLFQDKSALTDFIHRHRFSHMYISPFNSNINYDPDSLTQLRKTQDYILSIINRGRTGSQYDSPYNLRIARYVMDYYIVDKR
jgi:hypothetical protein